VVATTRTLIGLGTMLMSLPYSVEQASATVEFDTQIWALPQFRCTYVDGPARVTGEYGKTRARRRSKPARPYI
jgi:hypothetical protein